MRFPIRLTLSLTKHVISNRLHGRARFPIVLMLEPTHFCNLKCAGCGKVVEFLDTLKEQMSVERCLAAVDEADAPIVSICGGEPTLYHGIQELVAGIVARRKHCYLCSHGMYLERNLPKFRPSAYLTFNVSLDGLAETHDRIRGERGVFDRATRGIEAAKATGFRVITNTTIFSETDLDEVEALFEYLKTLRVDAFLITAGFGYTSLTNRDFYLERQEAHRRFRRLDQWQKRFRFHNTPIYLDFLQGRRHLDCTPWGNVNFNPQGWKGPCYLITDAHYPTMAEMFAATDWDKYEHRRDARCTNCMVHSGAEPTVMRESASNLRDLVTMIRWNLT